MSKLFETVNSVMSNNDGKSMIGYTLSPYNDVLNSLQKAKDETQSFTSSRVSNRSYTVLDSGNIDGKDDGSGFVINQYQAVVVFRDYMSFVVEYGSNEKSHYIVPVCKNPKNIQLNAGIGCISGQPVFLADGKKPIGYYKGLTGNESFVVGVGIDIGNLGLKFFQKHFPDIDWKDNKLRSLAARKCLFAEVLLPIFAKSSSAKVLHAMVTADIPDCQGAPFQVHIPNPLLLLSDYESLGTVRVKCDNKSMPVGVGDLQNPYKGSKFNHKTGQIDNFGPTVENLCIENTSTITYEGTSLCSGSHETKGRIRLYFDPDKKDMVYGELGEISDEYAQQLFSGSKSSNSYIRSEEVSPYSLASDIYFPQELADIIDKAHYLKALAIIRTAEVGNPTPKGAGFVEWNVANDGAGITYGNYQTTGKSGGLRRLIELYVSDSNSNPSFVQELNAVKSVCGKYSNSKTAPEDVKKLMDVLEKIGNQDPNMGYIQSKHLYEEQIQRKNFISSFKLSGLKSPLGFTIALHSYNQGRPSNFWTGVAGAQTENEKCSLILQHERNYLKTFSWWKTGGNHDRYTSDYKTAINNGNFDLSQRQRWCNATF